MRVIAVLIVFACLAAGHSAIAGPPPAYFVDEAKLPIAELPGLPSQRLWGIHNGAGSCS